MSTWREEDFDTLADDPEREEEDEMLIWSDAVFAPGQVLRTCPDCGGDGWTETVTCKRCGGEGVLIERGDWDGPFAEDSAHVGRKPAGDAERGNRGWTS